MGRLPLVEPEISVTATTTAAENVVSEMKQARKAVESSFSKNMT
jgi:hypothetical protein